MWHSNTDHFIVCMTALYYFFYHFWPGAVSGSRCRRKSAYDYGCNQLGRIPFLEWFSTSPGLIPLFQQQRKLICQCQVMNSKTSSYQITHWNLGEPNLKVKLRSTILSMKKNGFRWLILHSLDIWKPHF